jgi:hypothetical protein
MSLETSGPSAAEELEVDFDVFLSHSSKDRKTAAKIQKKLESIPESRLQRPRIRVFRDRTDLGAIPDLQKHLGETIARSGFILLLLTPNTVSSHWVKIELEYNAALPVPRPVIVAYTGAEWSELIRDFPEANGALGVEISSRRGNYWPEQIAAGIRDIPADRLIQRTKRARRRLTIQISAIVAGFVATILWLTSKVEVRREVLTGSDPSMVAELEFRSLRLDVLYDLRGNQSFPSETAFEFSRWRGRVPTPVGVPKSIYRGTGGVVNSGSPDKLLSIDGGRVVLMGEKGPGASRAMPREVPLLEPFVRPVPRFGPLAFDGDFLPNAMQDSDQNVWIYRNETWNQIIPESSPGSGKTSIFRDLMRKRWLFGSPAGLEALDDGSSECRRIFETTGASGPGTTAFGKDGYYWIGQDEASGNRGVARSFVMGLDLATLQPLVFEDPLEKFPETGGVHTVANFFWNLKLSSDGALLTGLSLSNRVSVWEARTGRLLLHAIDQNYNGLTAANISADGRYLALAEWGGRVLYFRKVLIIGGFDVLDLPLWLGRGMNGLKVP